MRLVLPYIAAIPVGNEIVVQFVEREGIISGWNESEPIVLDKITGIVWCAETTPDALDARTFAVEAHSKELRQSRPMLSGRVVACTVRTKGSGKYNHMSTALEIEELPATAFR
jgi:hypothetical protein